MKKKFLFSFITTALVSLSIISCNSGKTADENTTTDQSTPAAGQSAVNDDQSQKDIVKVAVGSKDHTTLVTALKAAEYVDVLSNAGPFTVFAPTNDAFNKLPAGTVEGLLKPEAKKSLRNILEYHVTLSALKTETFKDGQNLGMVNGDNATITVKDGKVQINGANIIASVPCSNGMIHIVDAVLLPPAKAK